MTTTRARRRRLLLPILLLLPFLILTHTASAATQAEKDALLLFKSSLISDPKSSLSSWTLAADPCRDFFGITCSVPSNSIDRIRLHSTGLTGPLSSSLASLPAIQSISLFDNLFSGPIPTQLASIPTLHKLNLSRNSLTGPIPPELGSIQSLRLLDLSWNNLSGTIPPLLFTRSCFRLRYVSLAHNTLTGVVPRTAAGCGELEGLDFSFNGLTGEIPTGICTPPRMSYLSFRSNAMSGNVSDRLVGCGALRLLDLGSNGFTGQPPLGLLNLPTLTYFNVSFNGFAGNVDASSLSCGSRVAYLDVSGNQITGTIQPFVSGCAGVKLLGLGSNQFTGGIPSEIGDMKSLTVLSLGGNPSLGGEIPPRIGDADFLVVLDLRDLNLTGTIPESVSNLRFLLQLDASGNQLEGPIPQTFNNMTWIKVLDLHNNLLDGLIPDDLGDLSRLTTLDLSQNSLDGPIPPSLANLTQLTIFNVSYNNLTGQIPQDQTLLKFGPEAFSHNPGLCGAPLNAVCAGQQAGGGGPSKRAKLLSTSAIVAIVAAAVILIGVCLITVVNLKARGRRRKAMSPLGMGVVAEAAPSYSTKSPSLSRERAEEQEVLVSESLTAESAGSGIIIGKLVLFGNGLPSRHEDWEAGTKALLDKNAVIGRGSLGKVYRATLQSGTVTIAVKKLEGLGSIRDQDEFEQEIGRLGAGVRHPDLVAFHGYYWSPTAQLLLTEFITNGNLHVHLHGSGGWGRSSGSQLPWPRRFGVAVGTARALAYLHHDCKPQVLHLNLKSTNVLLDDDFRPKLSDYGLARLMLPHHRPHGYAAPELSAGQAFASDKCDVYSFGVLLLELVTGRQPAEASGGLSAGLPDYIRGLLERGAGASCFDRRLRGVAENELIQVLKFGLICTAEVPPRRPSMAEVVQYLESIRPALGAIS